MVIVADGTAEVLDVADPDDPVRRARLGTTVHRAHLTDSALYLTSDDPAIAGYLLSQLGDPEPTPFTMVGGERPNDVETSGDGQFIYGLYGTRLRMFESMDVESPQRANLGFDDRCRRLVRHPHRPILYLACNSGVMVVDAADMNFRILARRGGGNLYDLALYPLTPEWSMIYAAAQEGVSVFNAYNPTDVDHMATVTVGAELRRITVQPDWILVGSLEAAMLLPRSLELGEEPAIPTRTFPTQLVAIASSPGNFYGGTRTGSYRLVVESGE
jgi:hypothetical protein